MGGNKGKTKPFDGRKWLDAFLKGTTWDDSHQWRLERLAGITMELHSFFNNIKRNQIPGEKLKRLQLAREQIPIDLLSKDLRNLIEKELNALEIKLYQDLLPWEIFERVTQNFPRSTAQREWDSIRITEFLGQLQQEFQALPVQETLLKRPYGKALAAGSQKSEGTSWKSSAIVRKYILEIHDLFKQFYPTTGKGFNIAKSKGGRGLYPARLMEDIAEFFEQEFPKQVIDLTDRDVIARIQYEYKTKIKPSSPKGKEIPN